MFKKNRKLLIPGPTEVKEEVLLSQAKPMISHRGQEFSSLYRSIIEKLQSILNTKNDVFVLTSSGTGAMEAATRNFIQKKSLHVGGGEFAKRWYKIAQSNGKEADLLEVELGKGVRLKEIKEKLDTGEYDCLFVTHNETSTGVLHPIREIGDLVKNYPDIIYCVDAISSLGGTEIKIEEWGIDVLVSSTQKCLAVPPGLAIAVISEKAFNRAEKVENKGYYFDFLPMKERFDKKGETPATPAISLFYALNCSLDKILKEGVDNRYKRHLEMANIVRNWAENNFGLFAEKEYLSPTLTVVKNTKEIDVSDFIKQLKEEGFIIVNGYGKLKEKTFRIAHMGELTPNEIEELIINMNQILSL